MNLKNIILLFCILLLFNNARAQNGFDLTYDFCTDTAVASGAYACLADTNFFLVANVTKTDGYPYHTTLASFDYSGQLMWSKKLLFPGLTNKAQSNTAIKRIGGNRYLFIGTVYFDNIGVWYPYLYVFNSQGDSLHYIDYPETENKTLFSSVLYQNNCFVTAGTIFNNQDNTSVLWLAKCDTLGNRIWEKKYLHANAIYYEDNIVLSADSQHYLITGVMYDTINNISGSCMMKVDTAGNMVWFKRLPKPYLSYGYMSAVANPNGGYYFVSSISKDPVSAPDSSFIYYGKLNEAGDTLWTKTFRGNFGNCEGHQIEWTPDRRHLVMLTAPYSAELSGSMKVDTMGNVVWYRIHKQKDAPVHLFEGGNLLSLSVTPDDRYLMAGFVETDTGTLSWMILTDSNGCRYSNDPACDPLSVKNSDRGAQGIMVYPNPVSDEVNIAGLRQGTAIRLKDMSGRLIYESVSSKRSEKISTASLPPGIYILTLVTAEGEFVHKVTKI